MAKIIINFIKFIVRLDLRVFSGYILQKFLYLDAFFNLILSSFVNLKILSIKL